jgi:hypothetical protein
MKKLDEQFMKDVSTIKWDELIVPQDILYKEIELKHGLTIKEVELASFLSSQLGVVIVCIDRISYKGDKEITHTFRVYGKSEYVGYFLKYFKGVYRVITQIKNRVENYKLVKGNPIALAEKRICQVLGNKIKELRDSRPSNIISRAPKMKRSYLYQMCENVIVLEKLDFKKYVLKDHTPKKLIKCSLTNEYRHRRILKWE